MTTAHIKIIDSETLQVMVFLNTRGNAFKDFTTKMPIWRLPEWLNEWIDNPEYICERDFNYKGPQESQDPVSKPVMTLEKLGLLMSENNS